jgi:hypothetical protein
MSRIVFDGIAHTVTLTDKDGNMLGAWPANNRTDSRATLRFVPNGPHAVEDMHGPHRHTPAEDAVEGEYGTFGIVRFGVVGHEGVGVHAGRRTTPDGTPEHGIGPEHVTMGCIRTTEEAMAVITETISTDVLIQVLVQNNHNQRL